MTTTAVQTLSDVLTKADPNELADALRKVNLGNMLQVKILDTGAIAAAGSVVLPEPALHVISARIVTATTASKVGTYMVTNDTSATKLTAGTSGAVGIATLATDLKTIAFEAVDATRVVVAYIPAPAIALSTKFAS